MVEYKETDSNSSSCESFAADARDVQAAGRGLTNKRDKRRLYNRLCAARSRKRTKELLTSLQEQVDELSKEKAIMLQKMQIMHLHIVTLEKRNSNLKLIHELTQSPSYTSVSPMNNLRNALLSNSSSILNSMTHEVSPVLLPTSAFDFSRAFPPDTM
jgi:hypothetical protein